MPKKRLTKRERHWAFQHAKQHVLEAITETEIDEHHSIINECGEPRFDIQAEVMQTLAQFKKLIRSVKYAD